MNTLKRTAALLLSVLLLFSLAACKSSDEGQTTDPSSTQAPAGEEKPEAQIVSIAETEFIESYRDAEKRTDVFLADFVLSSEDSLSMDDEDSWRSYSVDVEFYNRKGVDITVLGFEIAKNGTDGIHICPFGDVSEIGVPASFTGTNHISAIVLVKATTLSDDEVLAKIDSAGLSVKYVKTSDYNEDEEIPASLFKTIPIEPMSGDAKLPATALKLLSTELYETSFLEDYPDENTDGIIFNPALSDDDKKAIRNDMWSAYTLDIKVKNTSESTITLYGIAVDENDNIRVGAEEIEYTIPASAESSEFFTATLLIKTKILSEGMFTEEDIIDMANDAGLRILYRSGTAA